ncbi:hypothetical protein [Hyphomonas jannaschiana]|uniref:hypothetical protein n=1 Tax=Hyphomonas jannaschiana TaxID=86 RepID=UPI0012DF85FA|nr:hypothetical protein [Hyphomonas jannaschiana]
MILQEKSDLIEAYITGSPTFIGGRDFWSTASIERNPYATPVTYTGTGALEGWFTAEPIGVGAWSGRHPPESWLPHCTDLIPKDIDSEVRHWAEFALNLAASKWVSQPSVYGSPEGGVVIEHRKNERKISVVLEDNLGLIVSSTKYMHNALSFELNLENYFEFFGRYSSELGYL